MSLLLRWIAAAAAVAAAAYLVPGIHAPDAPDAPEAYLAIALILGLVNALVRPLLQWLSCALIALTLGLFLLVINAGMLMLTAWLARQVGIDFVIDSFAAALLGSIIISFVSFFTSLILNPEEPR